MNDGSYRFREIEQRWRDYWIENKTFKTPSKGDPTFDPFRNKFSAFQIVTIAIM